MSKEIDADAIRELSQLWYVAGCYMDLASALEDECNAIDPQLGVI